MAVTGHIVDMVHGYGVTLPDGWVRIDLTTDFLTLLADKLKNDPNYAQLVAQFQVQLDAILKQGVNLLALRVVNLDPSFATNLNIISTGSLGFSIDTLEALNLAQLKQIAYKGQVSDSRVTFSAGEAVYFTYKINVGGTVGLISERQYLFVSGSTQYIVTVSGLPTDKSLTDAAKSIAASFEILPK